MSLSPFKLDSNRIKPAEQFVTLSKETLHELLHSTTGFEVSSIFQKNYDGNKLSAVGSSILALVQALTAEAQLTGCRSVILDAENGKIMISSVPNANQPMILIVVTKQQVLLGQIMHAMNKATARLVELDSQHHGK